MELKELSNKFYSTYNNANYPNILRKKTRSYSICEIEIGNNKYGIPVKTNIKHSSSFLFKESNRRKTGERPGLDFKHSIVIVDDSYIDGDGHIDEKESKCIIKNETKIINDYIKFLKGYKKFIQNPIGKCWESWRYSHTSLEYFWDELGIIVYDKEEKRREVDLAYNVYLIIKNLCNDSNAKIGEFFVRRIGLDSVSISCSGYYLIKELKLNEVENYTKIITKYDENGDVSHEIKLGDKYPELLNKFKSFRQ